MFSFESIQISKISLRDLDKVRDKKDTLVYAARASSKPEYFISGDETLRKDLANSPEISAKTKVCSSKEFLTVLWK